ncbi:MAG: tripartite tricarboxylate transporter permease [Syntrophomonadaceae bacterium]|nr:tripartite tricarboxylate transporter permease [Syntrophomonadaceae bacterium]
MWTDVLAGLVNALTPVNLLIMSLALAGGIIIGTLPGLTATMGVALLVPLTFAMEPATGLLMLGAMYCGAIYGGANSAILINVPGTPAAVCTTFDGYPLTQKGKADSALFTALFTSVIGGIIGTIPLLLFTKPLAMAALKFGPPEYFWLAIFGLTIISALSSGNLIKGLLGGTLGLLLATIGIDPSTGLSRFTFGSEHLVAGITLVPAMIGFFSMSMVLGLMDNDQTYVAKYEREPGVIPRIIGQMLRHTKMVIFRSSIIGTIVGILPGAGGNIASFIAYNETKRFSKQADQLGKGSLEGIAASESANNATVSSSLIPLLALGIPGSPVAAVLLGGLLVHGLLPGPRLFTESAVVTYTFIVGLFVANILMLFVGYAGMKLFVRVLSVPNYYVAGVVMVLSVIGSYAIRNDMVDVYIMLIAGLIGYVFNKVDIQPGPIVLGLILGTIAEIGFFQSWLIGQAQGSIWALFFTRPISVVLILMTLISIISPIIADWKKNKTEKDGTAA